MYNIPATVYQVCSMKQADFWIFLFIVSIISGCSSTNIETATETSSDILTTSSATDLPPTTTMEPFTATSVPQTPTETQWPTITLTPTDWPTHTKPMPIVYFIGFRTDKPPFDDVGVRKAFAQAIDRQQLANDLWANGSTPATSLVPPSIWPDGRTWYQEIGLYSDVSSGNPGIDLDIEYDGFIRLSVPTGSERMAQLLREQWQARLGIVIAIDVYDRAQFDVLIDTDKGHMYFGGWFADYASPYNFLGDGIDYNIQWLKWTNDEYQRLIEAALAEPDINKQIALYVQAERILCEVDVVVAPLFHDVYHP